MTTSRKVALMIAGGLWFVLHVGFYFVIPVFASMFADFDSRLPLPTQLLIDCAAFFRNYPVVASLVGLAVILVGADIERRNSVFGVRLYCTISLLAVITVVTAMCLPIFQLGAVASGLQK